MRNLILASDLIRGSWRLAKFFENFTGVLLRVMINIELNIIICVKIGSAFLLLLMLATPEQVGLLYSFSDLHHQVAIRRISPC